MIIVSETYGNNQIKFIPRPGYIFSAVLIDETTGEEKSEFVDFTTDGYYTVCTLNSELVDQRRYNLKIYSSKLVSDYSSRVDTDNGTFEFNSGASETLDGFGDIELLYNDIIFCSKQDINEYSIDNGELDFSEAPIDYDNNDATKTKYTII